VVVVALAAVHVVAHAAVVAVAAAVAINNNYFTLVALIANKQFLLYLVNV